MPVSQGQFVWYELMTTDTANAGNFYCEVVGWTAQDAGPPHDGYKIFKADQVMVGGMGKLSEAHIAGGAAPAWIGYIGVADIDATVARMTRVGGSIVRGPAEIPEVGRFAVMADPHGATTTLLQPLHSGESPPAADTPGRIGWHELHAGEREAAFGFYADLFGWTKVQAVDMGPMGIYQIFATAGAPEGHMTGGIMTKMSETPRPYWLYYFNVAHIDAAVARAKLAGGQLLNGPNQVPGGSWVAQCRDPQGAMFAMVGPHR